MTISGAAAVEAVVEAGGAGTTRVMSRVEDRMVELVSGHGQLLARHGGETITAGGKRLRPLLVCIAAGVPVAESEALVRAAVAVELVHAATLVHDDVIDGADLRRGRPTVVAYRRSTAGAGDGRSAVLARLRRAGGGRLDRADQDPLCGGVGARGR